MKALIILFSLIFAVPLRAHEDRKHGHKKKTAAGNCVERLYIGAGLLDRGHTISVSITQSGHYLGYLHKVSRFKGETYVSDSIWYGYKVNSLRRYSLFVGGVLGFEQHEKSVYFGHQYITLRPRLSLWRRYASNVAIGIDAELGKTFIQTKARNGVPSPVRGYEPRPEVSIGINFKFN